MRKVLCSKLPPVAREFSGGGAFALGFVRNCDITPALFNRGGSVLAVGSHFVGARARITHQPQVRGRHHLAETRNLKRFLKKSTNCT